MEDIKYEIQFDETGITFTTPYGKRIIAYSSKVFDNVVAETMNRIICDIHAISKLKRNAYIPQKR